MKPKSQLQAEALERQQARDARKDTDQLRLIEKRPGSSQKEAHRLLNRLEAARVKPKKKGGKKA